MSSPLPTTPKSLHTLILPAPPSCILHTSLGYIVGTYTLHKEEDAGVTSPSGSAGGSAAGVATSVATSDGTQVVATDDDDDDDDHAVTRGETKVGGGEQSARRTGSLCVLDVVCEDGGSELKLVSEHETESAVFDICQRTKKSSGVDQFDFLAVANSTGAIELWIQGFESEVPTDSEHTPAKAVSWLKRKKTAQLFDTDTLLLKLSAHPDALTRKSIFAVTLSDGSVAVVDIGLDAGYSVLWREEIHSLEPWDVVWMQRGNKTDDKSSREKEGLQDERKYDDEHAGAATSVILSGGDDSAVHLSRITSEVLGFDFIDGENTTASIDEFYMITSDTKTHGAGVTAILPLSNISPDMSTLFSGDLNSLVLTGSYDDHIRLLRPRRGKRWETLAECNLGGGVWRLLPLSRAAGRHESPVVSKSSDILDASNQTEQIQPSTPSSHSFLPILASCMYAGVKLIMLKQEHHPSSSPSSLGSPSWSFEILSSFTEHESMNYGGAVVMPGNQFSSPCDNRMDSRDRRVGAEKLKDMLFITTSFYDRRACIWKAGLRT